MLKNLKYIPWIIICGAIALVLAYLKIRYATPIYTVQSSMMIKNQESIGGKGDRFDALMMSPGSENLSNEIRILTSRPVLKRVINSIHLTTRYYNIGKVRTTLLFPESPFSVEFIDRRMLEMNLDLQITILNDQHFIIGKEPKSHLFGEILNLRGNKVVLVRNPIVTLNSFASPVFYFSHQKAAAVVNEYLGALRISQSNEQSTILDLSFQTENTDLGVAFLNSLMNVYDSLNIEDKNRISINSLNFINMNLDTLQAQLDDLEGRVRNFRVSNDMFDAENQSRIYLDNAEHGQSNIDEMDVKMAVANYLQKYIDDPKKAHETVPVNMGIEDQALGTRISEYNKLQLERDNNLKTTTTNNPLIQAYDSSLEKIRRDMSEAINNIKNGYAIARDKMVQQNGNAVSKLRSMPGKTLQLGNVARRQKILEELYSFLLQKKLETSISSASTISNSTVVEPALGSGKAISPNKNKIYSSYLIFGLLIPVGVIAVKELLRDKVNNRIDVERRTHAPILGEIGHSDEETALVVLRNSRRFVAEQFRILRSNLKYMTVKKDNPSILVTSSFSGEGKSFISINMASVLALSGKKTVIMEFDIRKPKVMEGLGMKRKMGITNYIIGRAQFKDIIMQVPGFESLYVIACGPIPPNPAELLLDAKLDDLMAEVRANFEVIIMDTAPVGLVSDSVTLGKYADCTMFVVRMGHTYRKILRLVEDLYLEKKTTWFIHCFK
ncbi:MAG: polysaccharide biosynthesis tyrosine autokinase [Puia sp.]